MLLENLVDRLEEVGATPLDGALRDRIGAFTLNALACTYAGAESPNTTAVTGFTSQFAGSGRASIWLTGERRDLLPAVFANSAAVHGSVQEDMHAATVTHPGTTVIPAVLGLGEHLGAPGDRVERAIVTGYEAVAQVGFLPDSTAFFERGWRGPSVFGTFGSAAAAGVLLGLDRRQMVAALALAANTASGICAYKASGTNEGGIANASAARSGLEGALLAGWGVEAAAEALEAPYGFMTAFAGGAYNDRAWPRTGDAEIARVYIKPFESCAYNTESIEAARRLVARSRPPTDLIKSVVIRSYAKQKHHQGCDNQGPFPGRVACEISGQFAVASVLLDGDLTPERYENYSDPALLTLTSRTTIEVDPGAEAVFPDQRISTVSVEMASGEVLDERVDDFRYPGFAEVAERFAEAAEPRLEAGAARDVIDAARRLETLADITELTAPLGRRRYDDPTARHASDPAQASSVGHR